MFDESHRLKEMPSGYDKALFNQYYKETKELRQKLAYGIDSRKFGVDYQEILSWFDVKFIHAFNRYYGSPQLKGFIIRALQTYKTRIIKNSYQEKHLINNAVDITTVYSMEGADDEVVGLELADNEEVENNTEFLIDRLKTYFKDRLSFDAYLLWEFNTFPPAYTLQQKESPSARLTDEDAIDFFDLPEDCQDFLGKLKKEIREVTKQAKEYFQYKASIS